MLEAYKDAYEEDSPVWEGVKALADMSIACEIKDVEAARRWDPIAAWDPFGSDTEFIDGPMFDKLIEEIEAKDRVAGEFRVKLRGASPYARQRYGDTALRNACETVRGTAPGQRSDVLVRVAYGLGKLTPGGYLGVEEAAEGLLGAAVEAGLNGRAARGTIARGMRAGEKNPKQEVQASPADVRPVFDWNDPKPDPGRFTG